MRSVKCRMPEWHATLHTLRSDQRHRDLHSCAVPAEDATQSLHQAEKRAMGDSTPLTGAKTLIQARELIMDEGSEYSEDNWLPLSGLQHFAFCKRQWALIHIEQQWRDNYLTTSGSLEHERAHDYQKSESRGDTLIIRDLRVFSRRLGLTGACDVVEFHRQDDGVPLHGRTGLWAPYPVEYKHGSPKTNNADCLQLCAQAMCLEEMLACEIPSGALFYQQIKRREVVVFSEELRSSITTMSKQMHDLYAKGHTPKVKPSKACKACSLRDICLPLLLRHVSAKQYIHSTIFSSTKESER